MNIKNKITLGLGALSLLIALLSVVGIAATYTLKKDTANILQANYHTLHYARQMLWALEHQPKDYLLRIEHNLSRQENNITETGELSLTQALRKKFEQYKKTPTEGSLSAGMRRDILQITEMNMQAIERKSERAKATADRAVWVIGITGGLCLAIAFALLWSLPANIVKPIMKLTASIKQIAAKRYSERVHLEGQNEFKQLALSFNIMAAKLEEYNASSLATLMMETKRIETLINNMPDPVIGLDENLKVIFANQEAVKIIGLSVQDLVGQYAQELAAKNDLMRLLIQDIMLAEPNNEEKRSPIKIYADNKESYFEKKTLPIAIVPPSEQQKRLVGQVIILQNVTQYKELDTAKTNFIATISHEFKTPIAAIKMSLQLLDNQQVGALNTEQQQLLQSIRDDADRLLKITGELLNMTQIESGNIQLSILAANPKEIIDYALQAVRVQAEQKNISVEVHYPTQTPQVLADKEKTAWVLINLLSNAIRYSHENAAVSITLTVVDQKLRIAVKDNGQGIAPQYQDKIFDRYFRVPGTRREGTGLGLAISKEFMEAQRGQIHLESALGIGSVFTISLHIAASQAS